MCFRWETLVLPPSKFRTFKSCKFITSFKIRLKEKEQNSANVPIWCYELLACFSFLFSLFPFLPFFPFFLLLQCIGFAVCTQFCFAFFCSHYSILLSVLGYVCGFPLACLLMLFPASLWATSPFTQLCVLYHGVELTRNADREHFREQPSYFPSAVSTLTTRAKKVEATHTKEVWKSMACF